MTDKKIAELEKKLAEANEWIERLEVEMRKQYPAITAVYDREVWDVIKSKIVYIW